ncbi:MAG: fibronectin type III domain-containing protein, partial [Paenibacillaceae bacterium]|nr:fibronectin type III domain-containing protein [Paenibacillaceae bacterium]
VSSGHGEAGQTVEVPIVLANVPASKLTDVTFQLHYDSNALAVSGVQAGSIIPDATNDWAVDDTTPGTIVFDFLDETMGGRSIVAPGTLAKVTFSILPGAVAGTSYPLAVDTVDTGMLFAYADGDRLIDLGAPRLTAGSVGIDGEPGSPGGGEDPGDEDPGDDPGETVTGVVYRVGPTREFTTLQAIAGAKNSANQPLLQPGVTVLVDGDATYDGSVNFTVAGTSEQPIVIRGVRGATGHRPVLKMTGTSPGYVVQFADPAQYVAFESFELDGTGAGASTAGVQSGGHAITIRDTAIHGFALEGVTTTANAGSLTLERLDLYDNGTSGQKRQITVNANGTLHPDAVFRLQNSYVQTPQGVTYANAIYSKALRNELYANRIEYNGGDAAVVLYGYGNAQEKHSDMVGNVFVNTQGGSMFRIGEESKGRMRFVNNTFLYKAVGGVAVTLFGTGGVESVEMHNNVFDSVTGSVGVLNEGYASYWVDGRAVAGSNNWVKTGASRVPSEWTGTLSGSASGMYDTAGNVLFPAPGSPLIDSGNTSIPAFTGHEFPNSQATPAYAPPLGAGAANATARAVNGSAIDIGAYEFSNSPYWYGGELHASGIADHVVTLAWNTPVHHRTVVSYAVYRDGALWNTVTGNTVQVTGLSPGTTYTFKVEAIDAENNQSTNGPSVQAKTTGVTAGGSTPSLPDLSVSRIGQSSLIARWSKSLGAGSGVADHYKLYVNNAEVLTLQGNSVRGYRLTSGLGAGQTYEIAVEAFDAAAASLKRLAVNATMAPYGKWPSASSYRSYVNPSATHALGGETGIVATDFDLTAVRANIGGVIGYTGSGVYLTGYSSHAMMIRLNTDGTFSAWNNTGFNADAALTYTPGVSYHVHVVANFSLQQYDVWITPPGGDPVQIASGYKFCSYAIPITYELGKVTLLGEGQPTETNNHFYIERHTVTVIDPTFVPPVLPEPVTYHVGPTRAYTTLQQVAPLLHPGDTVLVDGDATYTGGIVFYRSGTEAAPITIKGVRVNGKRPVISGGARDIIELQGDYYTLDGIEVLGAADTFRAIFHHSHGNVIRDCYVHNSAGNGILGADYDAGSLLVEYSEVAYNGTVNAQYYHNIYMASDEEAYPDAVFRLQYSYVHHSLGGQNVASRTLNNQIYYNWLESSALNQVALSGPDIYTHRYPSSFVLPPSNSEIIGNVIYSTTDGASVRVGGDGTGESNGKYRIVNNTFVHVGGGTRAIRLDFAVESVEVHNNVFYKTSGQLLIVEIEAHINWKGGYFGRAIAGSNNWVKSGSLSIPAEWTGTILGTDPGFVDLANVNLRPRAGSPLIGAAVLPTPVFTGHEYLNPLNVVDKEPPYRQAGNAAMDLTRTPTEAGLSIGALEYRPSP